jgi:uncharacterized protein (TIGR02271 family)
MQHDKRYENLERLDDYGLVNPQDDIRGKPLVDENGQRLGTIQDLLVGPDHREVVAIRLEDGRTCPVEPLEIHENAVVYGAAARSGAEEAAREGHIVEEERIPIVEERLAIGKRLADTGRGITVRTRVEAQPVSEDVTLRDEHVEIERRPVNERLDTAEASALLDQGERVVSMTEQHEEVVIAKDAVVTDEVVVRKTADERVEHVTDTVRKTRVDIDKP